VIAFDTFIIITTMNEMHDVNRVSIKKIQKIKIVSNQNSPRKSDAETKPDPTKKRKQETLVNVFKRNIKKNYRFLKEI
jgi:hypothetical protein